MSEGNASLYILAAYGVAAVLMAAEVWALVRRSRAQARASLPRESDHEG
jgi:heme exporter protein CcmD